MSETKAATMRIYQVVQNIDSLFGTYLVSAVVLAETKTEARRLVREACKLGGFVFQKDRIEVRRLGLLSPLAMVRPVGQNGAGAGPILAFTSGEDHDNPSSPSDD